MRKIEFIENTARKTQGLTGSNVEQFRDNPYRSCARETGQNSNDARLKPHSQDDQHPPVVLEYNLLPIRRSDLPFSEDLTATIRACLEQSRARCEERGKTASKDPEVVFFERALKTISSAEIQVLEIADYNTTGLTGPVRDPYSVFNSLVKADGDNNKQNADSGGSFGIGKNAAFAVSDLQTVIYSTLTEDKVGNPQFGCQARLQLVSHERNRRSYSAEGYWGEPDFYAIDNPAGLPDWMVRKTRGTSVFAVGFRWHEDWALRMALSVITNFLIAVLHGRMEFRIASGAIKINRSTLAGHLGSSELERIAEETGQEEALLRTRDLHNCLTSGAAVCRTLATGPRNGARLHILVSEDLNRPRSVLFVRNGMYITDNLRDFGFPFRSFSGTRPFVAVLEPSSDEPGSEFSELLKRMENPEHDNFSPERIRDDAERKKISMIIRRLNTDIRSEINSAARVTETESTSLDELASLFSGDPRPEDEKRSREKDSEHFEYGVATRPPPKSPPPGRLPGTAGGSGGAGKKSNLKGGTRGEDGGAEPAAMGARGPVKQIPVSEKRCRREVAGSAFTHRIYFTPQASGVAAIRLEASGLTSPESLVVAAVETGKLVKGFLVLELVEGQRHAIGIAFDEHYDGPVEISSFALEDGTTA
ncbi:MAG: hypothetical protein GC196_10555 [Hyphomonas sp.]|nr:hypothetical protein [Hyphomonas sp.]